MVLRPNLPDSLDRKLEEKDDDGMPFYKRCGYKSKTAFVSQAVKEKIEREDGV